jgi:hypothetical protein
MERNLNNFIKTYYPEIYKNSNNLISRVNMLKKKEKIPFWDNSLFCIDNTNDESYICKELHRYVGVNKIIKRFCRYKLGEFDKNIESILIEFKSNYQPYIIVTNPEVYFYTDIPLYLRNEMKKIVNDNKMYCLCAIKRYRHTFCSSYERVVLNLTKKMLGVEYYWN